jgi:hypothetical protein
MPSTSNTRRFTWSNGKTNPSMTRINTVFCTIELELLFASSYLHVPVATREGEISPAPNKKYFRFEIFWVHMDCFKEANQTAWNKPVRLPQPFKRLHIKLARTMKAIKRWRKAKTDDTRLAMVKEIILHLETAQKARSPEPEEINLLKNLKT